MMKLEGLIPMLETPDLRRTIDFYTRVLGFELEARWPANEEPTWCRIMREFQIRDCNGYVLRFGAEVAAGS